MKPTNNKNGLLMRILSILVFSVFLGGCSVLGGSSGSEPQSVSTGSKVKLGNEQAVLDKLYAQHSEWKGTKYKLGGLSKSGIDCSGFVHVTYKSKLGYEIPRSTELLAKEGKKISKSQLRAGDLVFFKTSMTVRHVGIYLEDGKFLHASTSKGVMISELNNVYWKKKYWKAIRL